MTIMRIVFGNLLSSIAVLEMAHIATESCDLWGDILEGEVLYRGSALHMATKQMRSTKLFAASDSLVFFHYKIFGIPSMTCDNCNHLILNLPDS